MGLKCRAAEGRMELELVLKVSGIFGNLSWNELQDQLREDVAIELE